MQIELLPVDGHQADLMALIEQYQAELGEATSDPIATADLQAARAAASIEYVLIATDRKVVGFAIVGRHGRARADFNGHTILAFFIMRERRRQGIGLAAAMKILSRHPGQWEIATHGANIPALSFWRSVADHYTSGRYEETWLQHPEWRGSIQTFSTPGD